MQPSRDGRIIAHHDGNFPCVHGESARMMEPGWDRIVRLRALPGGSRPSQFHKPAAPACDRMRLRLDLKRSPGWTRAHYKQIESLLRENELLDTAVFMSNDDAKARFRDKARISMNRARLREAMRRGEPLSERRFVFFHGRDFTTEVVEPARRAAVEPVPNINVVVQYPQGDPMEQALCDIGGRRAGRYPYPDRLCIRPPAPLSETAGKYYLPTSLGSELFSSSAPSARRRLRVLRAFVSPRRPGTALAAQWRRKELRE